jgi:hypothetical protein
MDASDMLDVLHYYFEEDLRYSNAEEADAVSSVRTSLYRTMYETEYRYKVSSKKAGKGSNSYASGTDFDDLTPFDPETAETKPYVPPTQFDSSGVDSSGILDGPLG